jgi:hypothetical protein
MMVQSDSIRDDTAPSESMKTISKLYNDASQINNPQKRKWDGVDPKEARLQQLEAIISENMTSGKYFLVG